MVLRTDVIAWALVWVFWFAPGYVLSAPVTTSTSDSPVTSTRTSHSTTNPYPFDSNAENSNPSTTIIIVCVVGSLALLGGAWGVYSCTKSKRKSATPTIVGSGGTNTEPTTMIYIPGEQPAMTALPALPYNAPQAPVHVDNETVEVGPGVILPPPPAYDAATASRPLSDIGQDTPSPPDLKRERTESMWKDLLVSQGRT
ncbi:putative transmembrane protein [Rhizoctonia solani 123E]|uniref:Putative transmembrane protein n=1 Tax=Rhizoctonia solani 123E TaxID=1423351 RepID=A0A074SH29_9AGAM|nr:putative transmembrane protein [Rhizoctonia solani 123E]